ncbi:hypothetical protein TIFTF001_029505 [Ficus carica]|uniref:Uncharacterized protein n=1 Tax=Ficus carica TaxID=3494 RepID=A0AA88DSN7_FICCA|nr:hypothetical protein TIFTF001_029505 [Ficus carica]
MLGKKRPKSRPWLELETRTELVEGQLEKRTQISPRLAWPKTHALEEGCARGRGLLQGHVACLGVCAGWRLTNPKMPRGE